MGIEEMILKRVGYEYLEKGIEQGIKQGIAIGIEQERNQKNLDFARKLLSQTDFSFERIADMVEVDVSFVKEVKASLKK
jgi:hypothetical protein